MFESSVMRVFSVFERELEVVVSCFEFVFCHIKVGPCVTISYCDSNFVYSVVGETRNVNGSKFFGFYRCIIFFSLHAFLLSLRIF